MYTTPTHSNKSSLTKERDDDKTSSEEVILVVHEHMSSSMQKIMNSQTKHWQGTPEQAPCAESTLAREIGQMTL